MFNVLIDKLFRRNSYSLGLNPSCIYWLQPFYFICFRLDMLTFVTVETCLQLLVFIYMKVHATLC